MVFRETIIRRPPGWVANVVPHLLGAPTCTPQPRQHNKLQRRSQCSNIQKPSSKDQKVKETKNGDQKRTNPNPKLGWKTFNNIHSPPKENIHSRRWIIFRKFCWKILKNKIYILNYMSYIWFQRKCIYQKKTIQLSCFPPQTRSFAPNGWGATLADVYQRRCDVLNRGYSGRLEEERRFMEAIFVFSVVFCFVFLVVG